MMPDYLLEETLDFKFTTRAFATGIPTVLAGTPVVEIYEDNSTTQITAAETLTVDFDGVVGLNNLRVVATAANGFEAGKSYSAVLSAGTVGGVSVVGEVVAQFSIERSPALARLPTVLVGGRIDASVGAMAANVLTAAAINAAAITAAKFGAGAIDANAIAANAIGSSEFAQAAADKMWVSATRALTDKAGFSLSATGLDAIVAAAVGMVEIAKAVHDRELTGVTHNITNSAGRRLRQLQERGVYQDGAIWIDTVNGTAGTEDFENGTSFNPVDNLADALTLATSVGLARFRIAPGSSLTFVSTLTNKQFIGSSWTLALGGQEITGTLIVGAEVSGTALMATGHADFGLCDMGICTLGAFELVDCGLEDKLTLSAAANYHFNGCFHHAASGTSVIIDFGAAVLNTVVHMHHHSGPVEIQNLGQAGTDMVIYEGFGALTLNANCVGGTVNIRGNITLVNNGSGMTINDDARIDTGQVNAEVDTAIADAALATAAALATVDTVVDAIKVKTDNLPEGIVKNAAFSFDFLVVLASDHVTPAPGLIVTGQRKIDAGAFGVVSGTIAEVSNGLYRFSGLAADLNGDVITYRFSSATADDTFVTIKTTT